MIRLHPLVGRVVAGAAGCSVVNPCCRTRCRRQYCPVHDLDRLQVTATRTQRALVDVPSTLDVIDREQLDNQLVRELKDPFRHTPGMSVTSNSGRFTGAGRTALASLAARVANKITAQSPGARDRCSESESEFIELTLWFLRTVRTQLVTARYFLLANLNRSPDV